MHPFVNFPRSVLSVENVQGVTGSSVFRATETPLVTSSTASNRSSLRCPAGAIEQLYARELCVQPCECGIHDLFVEGADIFSLNQLCPDLDWDDPDGSFSVASGNDRDPNRGGAG